MMDEKQIRKRLSEVKKKEKAFASYNMVFLCGYKMALQDVLEIKRPKAIPANRMEM